MVLWRWEEGKLTEERRDFPNEATGIGARVRRLRKKHGFTQSALARQIGIQQSDLSRMEQGQYRVSLDNLFRILSVFGMDIAEFFHERTAQPQPEPEHQPLSQTDLKTLHMLRRLSPQDREEVQEFIEFKARKARAEARLNSNAEAKESG